MDIIIIQIQIYPRYIDIDILRYYALLALDKSLLFHCFSGMVVAHLGTLAEGKWNPFIAAHIRSSFTINTQRLST